MLALGFGASQAEAVGTAAGSLGADFGEALAAYRKGWNAYDHSLNEPARRKLPGLEAAGPEALEDAYYLSANVIKASEDKTFPGAIVASLASPWGQAVSAGDPANTYFGSYREVFARDLYESWTGSSRPATSRPRAPRRSSCSSDSSCPTARCRATASSTARSRRTRSGRSSTRRRTRS